MSTLILIFKIIAVLIAASFLGNWFLSEFKKAKTLNKPWYAPYLTIPGVLIIIAIFIPVMLRMLS